MNRRNLSTSTPHNHLQFRVATGRAHVSNLLRMRRRDGDDDAERLDARASPSIPLAAAARMVASPPELESTERSITDHHT
ncbi:hypothetical protein QE152_g36804 [Popillia japonica]|uniref:Uncharacterized protein n=1 Tax=Popillia japonica TaxID=7064 RepID=A0AAW1ICS6_POPJA